MSSTIEQFVQHDFFNRIFNINQDIIMIYLSGSRLTGCIDDWSDYDLNVITPSFQCINTDEYVASSTGEKIHWFYNSIAVHTGQSFLGLKDLFGVMLIYFLKEDCIIYKNDKYSQLIDLLLKNKQILGRHAAILLHKYLLKFINQIKKEKEITPRTYSKHIHDICLAYYVLQDEPLDKQFLTEIKRIKWKEVDDSYKKQAFEIIKKYDEYCINLQYDYKIESEKLYNMLLQSLPGDK